MVKHHNNYNITLILGYLTAVIFLIIVLSSCSCDYHYRKLAKRCPINKDTLVIHDTLVTSSVSKDTIFNYFQKDTVILREGKLVMKYYYHDSTVYLSGKCLPDTIIREIRTPYEFVMPSVDYYPGWLKWSVIGFIVVLVIGFILKKLT